MNLSYIWIGYSCQSSTKFFNAILKVTTNTCYQRYHSMFSRLRSSLTASAHDQYFFWQEWFLDFLMLSKFLSRISNMFFVKSMQNIQLPSKWSTKTDQLLSNINLTSNKILKILQNLDSNNVQSHAWSAFQC